MSKKVLGIYKKTPPESKNAGCFWIFEEKIGKQTILLPVLLDI